MPVEPAGAAVRRRAFTIIEVLVAGALTLLLLLAVEACVRHIHQISRRGRDQIEARQQVRSFLSLLRNDLQAASHLFLGYNGTMQGLAVQVPLAGASGSSLLFAIADDDSLNTPYTVCLVQPRPRTQPDANNAGVQEILYHRYQPVQSLPANTPGALLPASLVGGGSRVFDTYLPAGASFYRVNISPNGEAVGIDLRFRVQPQRGAVVSEEYHTFVTLRNNV